MTRKRKKRVYNQMRRKEEKVQLKNFKIFKLDNHMKNP